MSTRLLTTANKYTQEECINEFGVTISDKVGMLKDIQTIVSTGDMCRKLEAGQLVSLDFKRYMKEQKEQSNSIKKDMAQHDQQMRNKIYYEIPQVSIDGEDYLHLDYNDVEMIISEYEWEEFEVQENTTIPAGKVVIN